MESKNEMLNVKAKDYDYYMESKTKILNVKVKKLGIL
jgi:hypothetical protein